MTGYKVKGPPTFAIHPGELTREILDEHVRLHASRSGGPRPRQQRLRQRLQRLDGSVRINGFFFLLQGSEVPYDYGLATDGGGDACLKR